MVPEVREPFVDLGGALAAVFESSNRSTENIVDKVRAEMDQAWKRMLSLLDMEYTSAVGRIRANVVRDNEVVLRNAACYTA